MIDFKEQQQLFAAHCRAHDVYRKDRFTMPGTDWKEVLADNLHQQLLSMPTLNDKKPQHHWNFNTTVKEQYNSYSCRYRLISYLPHPLFREPLAILVYEECWSHNPHDPKNTWYTSTGLLVGYNADGSLFSCCLSWQMVHDNTENPIYQWLDQAYKVKLENGFVWNGVFWSQIPELFFLKHHQKILLATMRQQYFSPARYISNTKLGPHDPDVLMKDRAITAETMIVHPKGLLLKNPVLDGECMPGYYRAHFFLPTNNNYSRWIMHPTWNQPIPTCDIQTIQSANTIIKPLTSHETILQAA